MEVTSVFVVPEEEIRKQAAQDGIFDFAVGTVVMRGGRVLVLRRAPHESSAGMYELPGGGVEDDETFVDCAGRETWEETGLKVVAIVGMSRGFDFKTSKTGLRVRRLIFLVQVVMDEVVDAVTPDPNEHDDFRWISPDEINGLNASDEMKKCLSGAFALRSSLV